MVLLVGMIAFGSLKTFKLGTEQIMKVQRKKTTDFPYSHSSFGIPQGYFYELRDNFIIHFKIIVIKERHCLLNPPLQIQNRDFFVSLPQMKWCFTFLLQSTGANRHSFFSVRGRGNSKGLLVYEKYWSFYN